MIMIIKMKTPVLDVENNENSIEICDFIANEYAIIKSKDEVSFDFDIYSNKYTNAMVRNIDNFPGAKLGKKP